jgi:hypothetical protein
MDEKTQTPPSPQSKSFEPSQTVPMVLLQPTPGVQRVWGAEHPQVSHIVAGAVSHGMGCPSTHTKPPLISADGQLKTQARFPLGSLTHTGRAAGQSASLVHSRVQNPSPQCRQIPELQA